MASPYLITGVQGDVHPRREIRDLYKNHPEQFTLFILGWDKIRHPDYQPLAARHVQQGGIHGLPYERWPGDPLVSAKNAGETPDEWKGYCSHASVLFPTWHRPSLLLLEQSISEAAVDVAESLQYANPQEGLKWKTAAKELRFPFWDWTDPSTGKEGVPKLLYQDNLELKMPGTDERQTHDNTLAHYSFGPTRPDGFDTRKQNPAGDPDTAAVEAYYADWERTYRWPSSEKTDPKEHPEEINRRLIGEVPGRGSWRELTSKVALLFNFPSNVESKLHANVWDEFSNTRFQSCRRDEDGRPVGKYQWFCGSLEQPHNTVHLIVGGIGHMMDNDYASFDPIFYLHHCNIDRLLAFWEHVYPDYYLGNNGYLNEDGETRKDFNQVDGKFGQDDSSPLKRSSQLTPFRKSDGAYWTPQDTHLLRKDDFPKHYTYPSIPDPMRPDDRSRDVVVDAEVTAEQRELQRAILQKHFQHDLVKQRQIIPPKERPLFDEFKAPAEDGYEKVAQFRQFVVSVQMDPSGFDGSYAVDVFSDTGGALYVGSAMTLARGPKTKCTNCQERHKAGTKSHDIILVPHDIVVKILNSQKGETAAEAIKNSLYAQISLPGGKVLAKTLQSATHGGLSLPKEHAPKLWLYSASVQAKKDPGTDHDTDVPQDVSPVMPYESYDWQYHGVLESSWGKPIDV